MKDLFPPGGTENKNTTINYMYFALVLITRAVEIVQSKENLPGINETREWLYSDYIKSWCEELNINLEEDNILWQLRGRLREYKSIKRELERAN